MSDLPPLSSGVNSLIDEVTKNISASQEQVKNSQDKAVADQMQALQGALLSRLATGGVSKNQIPEHLADVVAVLEANPKLVPYVRGFIASTMQKLNQAIEAQFEGLASLDKLDGSFPKTTP